MFSNFFSKIVLFMRYCGKYILETGRLQMTIGSMRIALWITKAANTHSEYLILNDFPLHQWLHDRVSVLRYAYIACFFLITC